MSAAPDPQPDHDLGRLYGLADHRAAVPGGGPEGASPALSRDEHAELARLRAELARYQRREIGETLWWPGRELTPEAEHLRADLEAGWERGVDRETHEEAQHREARRRLDAAEETLARGDRRDLSWADLAALPKPVWVLDGRLTVGWHGLAGPPEAGKSLLARNWLCEVAASGRTALNVFSEGQFDMAERFGAHPLISQARPCLRFLESAFSLASPADVAWFLDTYRDRRPALIVLDMVYGCGLPDDNGVRDVAPVINAAKRIAAELDAAVLAVGHPGLSGERRFRGSSMWRGSFDSEWHLGDGWFTAEKHKYADRRRMRWAYSVGWPHLRLLGEGEVFSREYERLAAIGADFAQYPDGTDADRARRLAQQLGVTHDHARKLIRGYRKSL